MKRFAGLVMIACLAGACSLADEEPVALPSPSGAATVDLEVVRKHAEQFNEELPHRPAGSQEEFAAATYILGTLQQAGYITRLESVPVENLVKSTDVLALPPSGDAPRILVVVPYDTPQGEGVQGASLGMFLELARALRVAAPDHDVGFVAMGAHYTSANDGEVGARRLAQFLKEQDLEPSIVEIGLIDVPGADFAAAGDNDEPIEKLVEPGTTGANDIDFLEPEPVLKQAGFEYTFVQGPGSDLAVALLRYLEQHGR